MKTKLAILACVLACSTARPENITVPEVRVLPFPIAQEVPRTVDVAKLIARLEREAEDNQRMAQLVAPYAQFFPGAQLYFQGRADGIRQAIQIVRGQISL